MFFLKTSSWFHVWVILSAVTFPFGEEHLLIFHPSTVNMQYNPGFAWWVSATLAEYLRD
jgi:hypothetical protein